MQRKKKAAKKQIQRKPQTWRRAAYYIHQRTFRAHEDLEADVKAFAKKLAAECGTDIINHSEACRVLLRLGLEQHNRRELNKFREKPDNRPKVVRDAAEQERQLSLVPRVDVPVAAE